MCRTHNALMAEQDYGKEVMGRFGHSASRVSEAMVAYQAGSASTVAGRERSPAGALLILTSRAGREASRRLEREPILVDTEALVRHPERVLD